jgi:hypothetical protein
VVEDEFFFFNLVKILGFEDSFGYS